MGRKLRYGVIGSLTVVLTMFVVALVSPGAASAATATITSISPSVPGGLTVTTSVTVNQSDCTAYGYCGWFLVFNAAPVGQSCITYNASQVAAVSPDLDGPGTTLVTLVASLYQLAPSYQLCEFAYLPDETYHYLASTTYTPPVTTESISVASEPGGVLGGTISVDDAFCGDPAGCLLSSQVYEQDGSASCASTPSGRLVYSVPAVTGPSAGSWPYSFTPSVSAGSIQVCAYNFLGGSLIASASYDFPPTLSTQQARSALRKTLLRRLGNARNIGLACSPRSLTSVRCSVRLERGSHWWLGTATARLSGSSIYVSWSLRPGKVIKPPVSASPPKPSPPSTPSGSIEGPGSYSHATDTQFCQTHTCIANFQNGNGYIVQCVDGEWSHSGGLQGACSYHGGEAGLLRSYTQGYRARGASVVLPPVVSASGGLSDRSVRPDIVFTRPKLAVFIDG
jgi:hypothetical protein